MASSQSPFVSSLRRTEEERETRRRDRLESELIESDTETWSEDDPKGVVVVVVVVVVVAAVIGGVGVGVVDEENQVHWIHHIVFVDEADFCLLLGRGCLQYSNGCFSWKLPNPDNPHSHMKAVPSAC